MHVLIQQTRTSLAKPTVAPESPLDLPRGSRALKRLLLGLTLAVACVRASAEAPRAAVFSERLPGRNEAFAREIAAQISAAGYAVEFIGVSVLTNASALLTRGFDLLALPEARLLPAAAVPAIENYLKQGGDLLALGLPAWESALFELDGQWISRADFDAAIASRRPERLLFDFATADLRQWQRTCDSSTVTTRHEIAPDGSGKALHVTLEKLTGWDTFMSPPLANHFPPGHTLTCFRARGTPHTKQLALEWTERDGSRWIATVDLTPEWKNYALLPEAFKAWEPPPTRRDKNDGFRPQNAARFVVGLAHSHTALEASPYEYWIAEIGTAPNPFGNARLPSEFKPPHLESGSPGYQFFPISGVVGISAATITAAQSRRSVRVLTNAATAPLVAIHPRPRGVGFNQDRAYRWEPLLVANDASSHDYRGAVAALLVHVKPPFRGGVWAVFTPADASFYRQPGVQDCLRQSLARMRRGIFLAEGGAEFFTSFPGQDFNVGARIVNFGRGAATNLAVAVEFESRPGRTVRTAKRTTLALAPGESQTVETRASLQSEREKLVRVAVCVGGEAVDSLAHEVATWRPRAKPDRRLNRPR
jgi:hypothetical protein